MGVGGRGDQHRLHRRVGQRVVHAGRRPHAQLGRGRLGRLDGDVVDRDQGGAGMAGEVARMHPPDAAAAEHGKSDQQRSPTEGTAVS